MSKMSKKKKIIIISASSVAVVLAGIEVGFCIFKNNNKVVEEQKEEETAIKIEFKDELLINLEDSLPTLEDYLNSGELKEGEITYKDDNDEEIELNELKIGTYKVFIDGKEVSVLKIVDEVKPELKVKELTINESDTYEVKDFVESCTDNSKEDCNLSFKEESMKTNTKEGTYDIVIVAKDSSENTIEQSTKLIIKKKETAKPSTNTEKKPSTSKNTNTKPNSTTKEPTTPTETEQTPESKPQIEESFVYGTKVTKTIYSNGRIDYKYDYSSFNGDTNSMKAEASSLLGTNANIYNEVLTFTNEYRSEVGATPLTLDNNLSLGASIRAIEMAYADKFDHKRPDGRNCYSVLKDLGVDNYRALGENIAYGYNYTYYSPKQVTTSWRNSPGHYANMISTNFTKLGVGYYKLGDMTYYVQMFGN